MHWGAPVADATVHRYRPVDFTMHLQAWAATITDAVNDPKFDGEAFVHAAHWRYSQPRALAHRSVRLLTRRGSVSARSTGVFPGGQT
jgi:hypothetical protein